MKFMVKQHLFIAALCWLSMAVDSTEEGASKFRLFLNTVHTTMSYPYREGTRVMTGNTAARLVPLRPLVNFTTSVALIVSQWDLHINGYYIIQNSTGHAYVFTGCKIYNGVCRDILKAEEYDYSHTLSGRGDYGSLEKDGGLLRSEVNVTQSSIRDSISFLETRSTATNATYGQLAQAILTLSLVVSEAARFTEIAKVIDKSLQEDSAWQPTSWDTGLMDSWMQLSTFVTHTSLDVDATVERWFPALNQSVTVRTALDKMAVIARSFPLCHCYHQSFQSECRLRSTVDAVLGDGHNGKNIGIHLFNGPNFVHVQFMPFSNPDDGYITITSGPVQSIYDHLPTLRGTPFVDGIDAAIRIPNSDYGYIFQGAYYARMTFQQNLTASSIGYRGELWKNWPFLRKVGFHRGIDAIFASNRSNEYYIFCGNQYAVVQFVPKTSDHNKILYGPAEIVGSWPSLKDTIFENGIDAAFGHPTKMEAFLFKEDQYLLINYASTNNATVKGPFKFEHMSTDSPLLLIPDGIRPLAK